MHLPHPSARSLWISKKTRRARALPLALEALEPRWLPSAASSYGQLPLAFEPNQGQAAAAVQFVAHGSGYALALAGGEAFLSLSAPTNTPATPASSTITDVVRLQPLGVNPHVSAEGQDRLPGISNYLLGNEPAQWHTNIPTFARVVYHDVYPGTDLVYYGHQGQLEYDWVLQPGASTADIRLHVEGAGALAIDAAGGLVLHTSAGDMINKAPLVYQDVNGVRHSVPGRYVLQDGGVVGVAVAAHDDSLPLVIDPLLVYSTYLGGSAQDFGSGIAVDSSGAAYITGKTFSTNFPTISPAQGSIAGPGDVFVAKLNASGTALVYSTYLGGRGDDTASGIAVDSAGDACITGSTDSSDFPTVHPAQPTSAGQSDAFIAKLNPAGTALVYSTYLGGTSVDNGYAIALDAAGDAYVAGGTSSTNFPTSSEFQSGDLVQAANAGGEDAFVVQLSPSGVLGYSTYLGGSSDDRATGIAVDSAGNAYVTGFTSSSNFPTVSALQAVNAGGDDAFVAEVDSAGASLLFSTYLGGSGPDFANGIALDSAGNAYITGYTASANFPINAALQMVLRGRTNAFVTKLNVQSRTRVYSTYLGGSNSDAGYGIAVDSSGNAYVTGDTNSTDFPTAQPVQAVNGGLADAFVAKLNPAGTALSYSTYLGGNFSDAAHGIALDSAGNAYITGETDSSNFPTAIPVQGAYAGNIDAFVAKIAAHFWRGSDIAVGSDDRTRLLWGAPDGRADVWAVTGASSPATGPTFGPLVGWSVEATASGGVDGLTRVLWTNANGAAALWNLAADGSLVSSAVFGPIPGWQARDVAVDSNSQTRILWFNSSTGKMLVWTVDAAFHVTSGPAYGPFSGWSAVRLEAGGDGLLRVLWINTNGAAAVWLLNSSAVFQSQAVYGPISGWRAVDVTVGNDNLTRVLWANAGASAAAIWKLNASLGVSATTVYGGSTLAGWQVQSLSAGGDGLLRMEWSFTDGTAALWLLGADGSFQSAGVFGPF